MDFEGEVFELRSIRHRKKLSAACAVERLASFTTNDPIVSATSTARIDKFYLEIYLRWAFCSGRHAVKRERLDWFADNPRYTKRFAFAADRRCRVMTVKDVAEEMDLDGGPLRT